MAPTAADDHEARLRATQGRLDEAKRQIQLAIDARCHAVTEARADGRSIYWIAQVLGVKQNAVRQILGLKRADDVEGDRRG